MAKVKIVTHAPIKDADKVREAAGAVGAGRQGSYTHCSFSVRGTGRFKPTAEANPHIGEAGKLEEVEEELIEFICPEELIKITIDAIKGVHPYEEVPIEVYKLENY